MDLLPGFLKRISRRCRIWFLIALTSMTVISPRPAYALFGVGDIVFDPVLTAGMFGQTGAQIAQLIQMYYMMVEFKNRYGSLSKIKSWEKLLKSYAVRSMQNLTRGIIYDIHRRGARITAETPTNPVLSAMISGRRKLAAMEHRFRRADDLRLAYNQSQFSIARLDREQVLRQRQQVADASAATNDTENDAAAVGLNPAAYGTSPSTSSGAGGGRIGSSPGRSDSFNVPGSDPGSTASTLASLNLQPQAQAANPNSSHSASASGAGQYVNPQFASNAALVTPSDPKNGAIATASTYDNASAAEASRMVHEAVKTLDAGVLQEQDAAVDFAAKASETLAENREAMMEENMKGPEPYLAHMIAQNDAVIQIQRFQLSAQRAMEDRAQLEKTKGESKRETELPLNSAAHVNALKTVKNAARGD